MAAGLIPEASLTCWRRDCHARRAMHAETFSFRRHCCFFPLTTLAALPCQKSKRHEILVYLDLPMSCSSRPWV